MGARGRDLLGARTQVRHRHRHAQREFVPIHVLADEAGPHFQERLLAGGRRGLLHEVREADNDVRPGGVEARYHLAEDVGHRAVVDVAAVAVEDLDEAAHVGAAEVGRQVHEHVDGSDGILVVALAVQYPYGQPHALDADAVDGYLRLGPLVRDVV